MKRYFYSDNRLGWFRLVILLGVCLAMLAPGSGFADDTSLFGEMDELSIIMEDDGDWPKHPLKKIGSAIIWEGPVETDGEYLYFAGIGARIIFPEEDTEFPGTRFIGFGGEEVTLEEMDLGAVHVNVGLTSDGAHVVKWVVQGPVLILRGRITELAPEYETLTVKGFDIAVTENTRLKKLRIFYPNQQIGFSDLAAGMPVRVVAHDVESVYLGLGVLAVVQSRPEDDGVNAP
jgi:hypothetical protein